MSKVVRVRYEKGVLKPLEPLELREGEEVVIGGLLSSIKKKITKGENQRMAIVRLEDLVGSLTIVIFPELYEKKSHLVVESNIVFFKGRFSIRGDQPQLVATDIIPVEEAAYNAGISRFRAIILTTITTSVGLYPLIFEKSFQAQFLKPMAASLAYGVFIGTALILLMRSFMR